MRTLLDRVRRFAGGILLGLAGWWILEDWLGLRRRVDPRIVSGYANEWGIRTRPLRGADLEAALALERELRIRG